MKMLIDLDWTVAATAWNLKELKVKCALGWNVVENIKACQTKKKKKDLEKGNKQRFQTFG